MGRQFLSAIALGKYAWVRMFTQENVLLSLHGCVGELS